MRLFFAATLLAAIGSTAQAKEASFANDQLIVRLKDKTSPEKLSLFNSTALRDFEPLVPQLGLYLVKVDVSAMSLEKTSRLLSEDPNTAYVQKDHFVTLRSRTPNDSRFKDQWSLVNPQRVGDISAPEAWESGTQNLDKKGREVVLAVIDGGFDLLHRDLKDNAWTNAGEIPNNGIDDDANGYVDDHHGWNAYSDNGSIPVDSHGTHVFGIASAKADNDLDVAGINWNGKVMSVAGASGTTSVILKAYGYVLAQRELFNKTQGQKGAYVVATNSSFGVDNADCNSINYRAWNDIYEAMGKAGILSAAATANNDVNVDIVGDVPTGCATEYVVSVTNTTSTDEKYNYAGYGAKTIDLGAPGTNILSTVPGNSVRSMTGTSMATPHVAGSLAFLFAVANVDFLNLTESAPGEAALALKKLLLETVDTNKSLVGKTVSGGRLNLNRAAEAIRNFH